MSQNLQNLQNKRGAAPQPCRRRKAAGWLDFQNKQKF